MNPLKSVSLKEEEARTSFMTVAECNLASQTRFDATSDIQVDITTSEQRRIYGGGAEWAMPPKSLS